MTLAQASVMACATAEDPYVVAFAAKRAAAVDRVLPVLARRLPVDTARALRAALEEFASLGEAERRAVVTAPLFGYWWHRLCVDYRRGEFTALADWVGHLRRFLEPVRDDLSPDSVELRGGILLGPDHPWIREYVQTANGNTRAEGGRGDVTPVPPDEVRPDLARALALIDDVWPAFGEEVTRLVRLIVPFSSADTVAFSNSVLDGLLFLRADLADPVVATERLVHETSHLRLNAVFDLYRVHEHGPEERLHSPYRKVPRPVDGLYHGAFVFARIAQFHLRAHRRLGEDRWLHRLVEVLDMQREALDLLRDSVRLTPFGQVAYEEFRRATEAVAHDAFDKTGSTGSTDA